MDFIKRGLIIIFILGIGFLAWRLIPSRDGSQLEIVDLEKLDVTVPRTGLLYNMIKISRDGYDEGQTFLLDDNDPSTKVVIGVYESESENGKLIPGGIIMLKRLPDGRDAIFWEIKSPLFTGGTTPTQLVKDINNDGLKEIVTLWWYGPPNIHHYGYWILTIDPHTKTYKVLNPIVDRNKNPVTDFDFAIAEPHNIDFLNRFQTDAGVFDVIQDLDNDGIAEIVLKDPVLGIFRRIRASDNIKAEHFTQTFKWNGREYYLWKEVAETEEAE